MTFYLRLKSILLQAIISMSILLLILSCSSKNNPVNNSTDPQISSLSSQTAYKSQAILISGMNFQDTRGSSFVSVNGVQIADSNYYRWGSTEIVFFVPNDAATGNVVVNINGKATNGINLAIVATHTDAPTAPYIDYLPQDIAQPRQQIGITGNNFYDVQGQSWVEFNGIRADSIKAWSNKSISVIVPTNAVSGKIVVYTYLNNIKIASNSAYFTVQQIKPVVDLVQIAAGNFIMGDNKDSSNFDAARPAHNVTISYPFLIGKCEVTQKQYKKVEANSNPSRVVDDNNPVESVTWLKAIQFCNDLSKMERYDTCYVFSGTGPDYDITCNFNANGYRLPTEAEWEYACRAGDTTRWGGAIFDYGWTTQNSNNIVHNVGLKNPNAWGLYDMHGNVSEWCNDFFDVAAYDNLSNPVKDPTGPATSDTKDRSVRGGAYDSDPLSATAAYREGWGQVDGNYNIGFRIVRKSQ
ncbi:MAG: SUMF1/EgtB/PvdO family nonheme iron enzyme [FCB group bacterium]|jgi:formylglycine-generating enzyme required for sulfatase activity